jgi:hypothetical protein
MYGDAHRRGERPAADRAAVLKQWRLAVERASYEAHVQNAVIALSNPRTGSSRGGLKRGVGTKPEGAGGRKGRSCSS